MMTTNEIANLIPDTRSRKAWIAAGMPTDLGLVAEICTQARQKAVRSNQATCRIRNPFTGMVVSRPYVSV